MRWIVLALSIVCVSPARAEAQPSQELTSDPDDPTASFAGTLDLGSTYAGSPDVRLEWMPFDGFSLLADVGVIAIASEPLPMFGVGYHVWLFSQGLAGLFAGSWLRVSSARVAFACDLGVQLAWAHFVASLAFGALSDVDDLHIAPFIRFAIGVTA